MTQSLDTLSMPAVELEKTPRPLLFALIWLSLLGAFLGNIQPMFLGALAESFSLDARQLGLLSGVELGGACLASLSAAYWFPRARLRVVGVVAVTVLVVANLLTTWVSNYALLLPLRFVNGCLGIGLIYTLALGLIGQINNPERIIAIVIVIQVLAMAVGMAGVPLLLATWQLPGVTVALALLFSTGFLVLHLLPECVRHESAPVKSALGAALLPAALLVGLLVFYVGLGSVWPFMERIGNSAGFAMDDIGQALAVSGMIGGLGALAAALLGIRLGRLWPIVCALGLQIGACVLLATRSDWSGYLVAIGLFNFGWNLAMPYLLGAIAAADTSDRFMVMVPAAQAGGFALGPIFSGLFIVGEVYALAAWISVGVFALCLLLLVPLVRRVPVV